ncbi:hypothetical protein U9M48_031208 [Paspalum notatum var. saurae]|uniref:Uncharacterized protein n=1 Tax=Paspalum notatum var. saurae TaxID=547442 RepID=A0AAQ3X346_PASNO
MASAGWGGLERGLAIRFRRLLPDPDSPSSVTPARRRRPTAGPGCRSPTTAGGSRFCFMPVHVSTDNGLAAALFL